uniref:Uncharacterized protein n=1 Tax=Caenorhabditis japonica TaxID=281687 RepID=A0A8R1E0N4_CAEJA
MSVKLNVNGEKHNMLNEIVEKLKVLQTEMPEDEWEVPENATIIMNIEKEFQEEHGFMLVRQTERLAPIPNGEMELEPPNMEQGRMLDILLQVDEEAENTLKQLRDDGVPKSDGRVMDALTRHYKNKILFIKYFSLIREEQ